MLASLVTLERIPNDAVSLQPSAPKASRCFTRSDGETLQKNHVKNLAISWWASIALPPKSATDDMEEIT